MITFDFGTRPQHRSALSDPSLGAIQNIFRSDLGKCLTGAAQRIKSAAVDFSLEKKNIFTV